MELIDQTQKFIKIWLQFHRISPYQRKSNSIKPSAFWLLNCLRGSDETDDSNQCNVSELSQMLQVTSPTVTQLVTQLETDKLVMRQMDPHDRRAVRVKLTKQGKQLVDQERKKFLQSIEGLIEHLGPERSQQFTKLMAQTIQYFQQNRSGEQ